MSSANQYMHFILFLFTFYTIFQLFWNRDFGFLTRSNDKLPVLENVSVKQPPLPLSFDKIEMLELYKSSPVWSCKEQETSSRDQNHFL